MSTPSLSRMIGTPLANITWREPHLFEFGTAEELRDIRGNRRFDGDCILAVNSMWRIRQRNKIIIGCSDYVRPEGELSLEDLAPKTHALRHAFFAELDAGALLVTSAKVSAGGDLRIAMVGGRVLEVWVSRSNALWHWYLRCGKEAYMEMVSAPEGIRVVRVP